jgi:hypothetical protein
MWKSKLWIGNHQKGNIEEKLTGKVISLSLITARVKSNGVSCRHQTKQKNDIFSIEMVTSSMSSSRVYCFIHSEFMTVENK